jgi:hypothetical protein
MNNFLMRKLFMFFFVIHDIDNKFFVVGISLFTDARRLAKSIILSLQNFIGFRRWVSIAL